MREVERTRRRRSRVRIKYPGRFIIFWLTVLICLWMIYNFIVALSTGQKFSIWGCASEPVRNIVVAGVDEGGYRTDLLLLCQINRRDGEVDILQIPRDTRVENKRNDKKINSAYYSGFESLRGEIEQITGLRADDYIMIGFEGFNDVIDAIGGVKVNVPIRMDYTDPVQDLRIDLQPGEQKLNGEKAQMFMRFRKNDDGTGYVNGDIDRIEAQRTLYRAVAEKVLSPAGILRAPAVLFAVMRNSETNMNTGEIMGMMRDVAAIGNNIKIHSLPGQGKYIGGVSYFVYDKKGTQNMISENFLFE